MNNACLLVKREKNLKAKLFFLSLELSSSFPSMQVLRGMEIDYLQERHIYTELHVYE